VHEGAILEAAFLLDQLQLFQPLQEKVRCSMRLFVVLRAFERMQDLVPAVHAGARLMLAREQRRVFQIADDASLRQPQLGLKMNSTAMDGATAAVTESSEESRLLPGRFRDQFLKMARKWIGCRAVEGEIREFVRRDITAAEPANGCQHQRPRPPGPEASSTPRRS